MKTIYFVIDFLERGGATRVIQDISSKLDKTSYRERTIAPMLHEEPINSVIGDIKPEKQIFIHWTNNKLVMRTKLLLSSFALTLFSSFKSTDIVIFNLPYSTLGFLLNPRTWKTKRIYIFHGIYAKEELLNSIYLINSCSHGIKRKFKKLIALIDYNIQLQLQRISLRYSQEIIVFSEYSFSILFDVFKIHKNKIKKVIPPTQDIKAMRVEVPKNLISEIINEKSAGKKIYLIPSRIEMRKGILVALEAINIYTKKRPNESLYIFCGPIGCEQYAYDCFQYVKNENLVNVRFTSTLSRSGLQYLYHYCDWVLNPSIDLETFGLITLESLQASVPVIAFNSGASPELLLNINKRLIVDNISAVSLATTLEWSSTLNLNEIQEIKDRIKVFVKKLKQMNGLEWIESF